MKTKKILEKGTSIEVVKEVGFPEEKLKGKRGQVIELRVNNEDDRAYDIELENGRKIWLFEDEFVYL